LLFADREQLSAYLFAPAWPLMLFLRPMISGDGLEATKVDYGLLILQQVVAAGVVVTTWGWISRLLTALTYDLRARGREQHP
jgi:hypothetical protein